MNKSLGFIDLRSTRPKGKKPALERNHFHSSSSKEITNNITSQNRRLSQEQQTTQDKQKYFQDQIGNDFLFTVKGSKGLPTISSFPENSKTTTQSSFMSPSEEKDARLMSETSLKRLHAMIVNFLTLENGTLSSSIDFYQYGIDSRQPVTNAIVQELCIIQPNMIHINLKNCREVTDVCLWAIAKHCNPKSLLELNLSGCPHITNIGLRSLSLRCFSIHTFNFSDCANLDDLSLTVIASGGWKLKHLYLCNCTGVTDTGVSRIARAGSQLEVLDLNGCTGMGEYGDNALKEIGLYCANLKRLDLSHCRRVDDHGIRAIALGCTKLEELILQGCERISGVSLNAIGKHLKNLRILGLSKCGSLTDSDIETFYQCSMKSSLSDLNLSGCHNLSDRSVKAISYTFAQNLCRLNLAGCRHITDQAASSIAASCIHLRELDMSRCPHVTDETIARLASNVSELAVLKLNRNQNITVKGLLLYLPAFEFAVISQDWLGYQPRENVMELRKQREQANRDAEFAIRIQSCIRRKYAYIEYARRKRIHVLTHYIPKVQAMIRGYFQRKKYRSYMQHIHRIKCAVKLQTWYRKYLCMRKRFEIVEELRDEILDQESATTIQRVFRGILGRRIGHVKRIEKANKLLAHAKRSILLEKMAIVIQSIYRGYKAREKAFELIQIRDEINNRHYVEVQASCVIQRIMRGKLGRIRAKNRRDEVLFFQYQCAMATRIQRIFRGYMGRLYFQRTKQINSTYLRNSSALIIQRFYRGHQGRLQASIESAKRALLLTRVTACVHIQRIIRGILGRKHLAVFIQESKQHEIEMKAACLIQKVFRGHKGREMLQLEKEMRKFDSVVKPLTENIRKLEESQEKLKNLVDSMMKAYEADTTDLDKLEMEVDYVMKTENKYCDSSRLSNYPQRFLTKYLRIRLKEFYDNKVEQFKVREEEIEKKVTELRSIESQIRAAKRELVPLTTGKIMALKTNRAMKLREQVRRKNNAAINIQAIWRRAIVRLACKDPARDYWIECIDEEQSEYPFYFNTWTQETSWEKPLAYKYFCDPNLGNKKDRLSKVAKQMMNLKSNETNSPPTARREDDSTAS